MNILIIASTYPNKKDPVSGVFIQRLVNKFADMDNSCVVMCPQNIFNHGRVLPDVHEIQKTEKGSCVDVYFPRFIGGWQTYKSPLDFVAATGERNYKRSIVNTIKNNSLKIDIIYAHFIGITATVANELSIKYGVPAFAACGESDFWTIGKYDKKKRLNALNNITGIVSVSTENKNKLVQFGIKNASKIGIFPNGTNLNKFHSMNQLEARKIMGFPSNGFIVGFAGYFIERKGPLRLAEAVGDLSDILVAFAGKGEQMPSTQNTIFCSQITPEKMPVFLNAIDIFVLPTLKEGCCNSIVEAVACGTPVVSSNRAFNDDILSDSYSIRVDPESIDEIREAVCYFKSNKQIVSHMAEAAEIAGREFGLDTRARKILDWMRNFSNE